MRNSGTDTGRVEEMSCQCLDTVAYTHRIDMSCSSVLPACGRNIGQRWTASHGDQAKLRSSTWTHREFWPILGVICQCFHRVLESEVHEV